MPVNFVGSRTFAGIRKVRPTVFFGGSRSVLVIMASGLRLQAGNVHLCLRVMSASVALVHRGLKSDLRLLGSLRLYNLSR